MRLVSRLAAPLSGRRRASFRLRSVLIAVVVIALGLAFVHDLRRQEIRKQLARREELIRKIVEGRSRQSEEYERRGQAFLKVAESYRSLIDRYEHDPSFLLDQTINMDDHIRHVRNELPRILRRAEWQFSMARIVRWAADHPREPWPPTSTRSRYTLPERFDSGHTDRSRLPVRGWFLKKAEEIGP